MEAFQRENGTNDAVKLVSAAAEKFLCGRSGTCLGVFMRGLPEFGCGVGYRILERHFTAVQHGKLGLRKGRRKHDAGLRYGQKRWLLT